MRLLASALGRIATALIMREVDPPALHALRGAFVDVPVGVDSHLLAGRSEVPRNELAFEGAVTLARLLLRGAGLADGFECGGLAYLVGLDLLFERAVVQALRESGLAIHPKHPLRHRRVAPNGRSTLGDAPMELDVYCSTLAAAGAVIDAKYKDSISSANLQQVLAYCHLPGARQAMLVVPAGGVRDRRPYRFDGPSGRVDVHLVEFDVRGRSVAAWRDSAARFAETVVNLGAVAPPSSPGPGAATPP